MLTLLNKVTLRVFMRLIGLGNGKETINENGK